MKRPKRLTRADKIRLSPTGRLPHEPNMQNIPVRTPEGTAIRAVFTKDIAEQLFGGTAKVKT